MADEYFSDKELCDFCIPSEVFTDEFIFLDKENMFRDKPNSFPPRTPFPTESPTESLSFFSNSFLVPPFSSSPKIPERTWAMPSSTQSILSPVVGKDGSVVPSPPVSSIGRNPDMEYYQVKNINSQGQNRNFTSINPSNALPSIPVTNGTVWGQQQAGGQFRNGGYEYDVTPGISWGGPQGRSCGGVEMGALGYGGGIKKRAGTGVFLPRRYHNSAPESRKKTGGSTTRPAQRVVQTQNKKFENGAPQLQSQRHFIGSGHNRISENELVMPKTNAASPQEWRKYETTTSNAAATTTVTSATEGMRVDNEIRLPQEWTY